MELRTDYDVIIVGAGPAGAACAMQLKKKNIKTLIIERKKLPRDKMCGGFLNNKSIKSINDDFGEIPERITCSNKWISISVSKGGYEFIELPDTTHLSIHRAAFDQWLINQTQTEIIPNCSYLKHIERNGSIQVHLIQNTLNRIITCKYLVGADGSSSCVRHRIDPAFKKSDFLYSYQECFRANANIDKNHCYYLFHKRYSSLYAWFFFKDDLVYIGTSSKRDNYRSNFKTLFEFMENEYSLKIENLIKKQGVFNDIRTDRTRFLLGVNNVLLIGDSAGLYNYLGEGISTALISGKAAADSISNNISENGLALADYSQVVLSEITTILQSYNNWRWLNPNEKNKKLG
jgi:geranylgeranyl reductase family protein